MTTPAHLGGHFGITNEDAATLDYLIERYQIRSMLDVGCGPGGMLDRAKQYGIDARGIDGDPALNCRDDIAIHDYTHGPVVAEKNDSSRWFFSGRYNSEDYLDIITQKPTIDLIWCVEFVEHVEEKYAHNFLVTFRCGRVLFMTHALPGQGGHHHVNEQPAAYWIDILQDDGWQLDQEVTDWVRKNAGNQYTKATGMVWLRGTP